MDTTITIVLAEDHTIVRQGLRLIIEQNPAFSIVGEADNGEAAYNLVELHKPDVLVSDISMPHMNGIELAKKITSRHSGTKILFLTMQDKEEYIVEAIQAGATGFLPKGTVSEELIEAIVKVAGGREYFSGLIYNKAFNALRTFNQKAEIRLTAREKEILQLLAKGDSTKMIAEKLIVSEYTVSNHRANLLRKLSANNVAELIRKASELQLLH